MDSLNYMMLGYLVIWGLAFGFVFSLWSRGRRVERELAVVRQLVEEIEQEER